MIKMHWKIQFILLLISLFFVGLGIESVIKERDSGSLLFRQFFHIVPFVISSMVLTINIWYQHKKGK